MKLRDKMAVSLVKRLNMNPEKKDKVVKKVKLYGKLGRLLIPHRLKRGFERTVYDVSGVPLDLYKRKGSNPKKMIYVVHGGVFILGLLNLWRNLHAKLSNAAHGAAVAVIDYRTAPEHKYPAAHDDVRAGWQFIQGLGYEPRDIVLMGDSSGGNLVLSLLLSLRDEGKLLPAAAVTMSPWTDLLATGASYKTNYCRDVIFGRKSGVGLDENIMQRLLECGVYSYAADADRSDPYLSPAYGEYHDFPPVLMTVGSHEMILDDTLSVAEKLKAAGGSVKVIVGEGMFHIYPLLRSLSPTGRKTFMEILSFIGEHTDPELPLTESAGLAL